MENGKMEDVEIRVRRGSFAVTDARCPKGCSLMVPEVPIHGHPSIGVRLSFGDQRALFYLDPVFGSFDNRCDIEIPEGQLVELRCLACGESLRSEEGACPICAADMFVLHLPNGGIVEGCLRKGCFGHKLRIVDLDAQILRLFRERVGLPGIDV
jgi:hypothetical protein